MTARPWLDVLDETIGACGNHGSPELVERLRQKRAQLLDPRLRVAVVGEPKQGKSQLVNALLNAPVCAVGDDLTTTVPTIVEYSDTPSAALVRVPAPAPAPAVPRAPAASEERVSVPIDEVTRRIDRKDREKQGKVVGVEIGIPRKLLADGLTLIDTPAVGGPDSARHANTFTALDQADSVLLATEATTELSPAEIDLLRRVTKRCPNALVVLTKIDIAPAWRQVAERTRAQLAEAGLAVPVLAVSAALRLEAARTGDRALNAESGFPDLLASLQRDAGGKGDALARRTVAVVATAAIEEVAAALHTRASTVDSGRATVALSTIQAAQRMVEDLRQRTAKWQNMLADDMADLISDIDYDLRDRTRRILREADRAFSEADPAVVWETFGDWLEDNLAEAAEANFAWLVERSRWIAHKIARLFPVRDDLVLGEEFHVPDDLLDHLVRLERPILERFTVGQKVFTGLRGSYGGVLMVGLATSLAGMKPINAISLAAGVVFGGKTVLDEGEARLKRRQAEAKSAVHRHVDDYFLKFSKECKDTARQVQRSLRDHFAALVEDLQARITATAANAKQALQADADERNRRTTELNQELQRLTALYQRAHALAAPPTALAGTRREITA
ncbi:dynamin family protein [Gandjariella thermophila]|uniref:Isoniazid inducible gene protein IniA n=1 Tax=Gandjariella thermophila TaxID=1931992 RepID=A0A4D4J3U4_9PSEU|nr:dynamin family protein [Gandjariella thermophila]GDY31181.1 isoniazid inducible gene protein IniA [Gandjariella thermophila]